MDKKQLEYELGRYRKKVEDQEKELRELRPRAKVALDGLAAAHATMNANMAVLAMEYGEKDGNGWAMKMPEFDPGKILEDWQVSAEKTESGYLIRVRKHDPV